MAKTEEILAWLDVQLAGQLKAVECGVVGAPTAAATLEAIRRRVEAHEPMREALELAMGALREAEAILRGEYGDDYGLLCEMMIELRGKADAALTREPGHD